MPNKTFQDLVKPGNVTLSTDQFAAAAEIFFDGGRNGSSKEAILGAVVQETGVPLLGDGKGLGV